MPEKQLKEANEEDYMRHTEEKMGRLIWKIKNQNELIRRFVEEEDAVGVVEIILILVVLIGLVIIFKEQLTELVQSILSKIAKQSNSI